MLRTILHSDLNNFYASVECRVNPEIRDKPAAVCGSESIRHGIVLAKNQLAKGYGVKTGMPVREARSICPGLVTVKPDFPLYLKYSRMVRKIYSDYTDRVEAFGIDECWLDVTGSSRLFGDGESIAWKIKERIKDELGITCSIGVSYNKVFAKLGSDIKKPDAITVIMPEHIESKVFPLPCECLIYIGRATKRKLDNIGVHTIGDLAGCNPVTLEKFLGKWGRTLWYFANGMDNSPVQRTDCEQGIKSIGNSLTTPRDLTDDHEVRMLLLILSESVGQRLRQHGMAGRTVQITIKDSNFNTIERQTRLGFYTNTVMEIYKESFGIFRLCWDWHANIRLLGVRVMDLAAVDGFIQMSMFLDRKHDSLERLDYCIDRIRGRFGYGSVKRALVLKEDLFNYHYVEEDAIHPTVFKF